MKTQTIILKKQNKMYGGYEYLEFSTEDKKFTVGNSSAHIGHGDYILSIEVATKKELKEKTEQLIRQGYEEIETFCLYV